MKITLCGSIKFADKIVEIYSKLEKLGHQPMMHEEMFGLADGSAKELVKEINEDHAETKRKHGFIKWWYNCIVNSDAILVCNFTKPSPKGYGVASKNNIENYIGGNTLMEIGFAHVHDKKVFLLNPVPEEVSYTDEIKAMVDVILEGDLSVLSSKL